MDREVTTMVSADVAHDLTSKVQATTTPAFKTPLRGSVLVLIQYDVCEEIRLDVLRGLFPARNAQATFKSQAPGYVRYQRTPVAEPLEPVILAVRRAAFRRHQVLRLRRRQPGLRAAFRRRLGQPGPAFAAGPPTRTSRSWPRASSARNWSAPLPR